jgi:hypothetical protein
MGVEQLLSLAQRQRADAAAIIVLKLRVDQPLDIVRVFVFDFLDQLGG